MQLAGEAIAAKLRAKLLTCERALRRSDVELGEVRRECASDAWAHARECGNLRRDLGQSRMLEGGAAALYSEKLDLSCKIMGLRREKALLDQQLAATTARLAATAAQLGETAAQLFDSRQEVKTLTSTAAQLQSTAAQLTGTVAQLASTAAQLQSTTVLLAAARGDVAALLRKSPAAVDQTELLKLLRKAGGRVVIQSPGAGGQPHELVVCDLGSQAARCASREADSYSISRFSEHLYSDVITALPEQLGVSRLSAWSAARAVFKRELATWV